MYSAAIIRFDKDYCGETFKNLESFRRENYVSFGNLRMLFSQKLFQA